MESQRGEHWGALHSWPQETAAASSLYEASFGDLLRNRDNMSPQLPQEQGWCLITVGPILRSFHCQNSLWESAKGLSQTAESGPKSFACCCSISFLLRGFACQIPLTASREHAADCQNTGENEAAGLGLGNIPPCPQFCASSTFQTSCHTSKPWLVGIWQGLSWVSFHSAQSHKRELLDSGLPGRMELTVSRCGGATWEQEVFLDSGSGTCCTSSGETHS